VTALLVVVGGLLFLAFTNQGQQDLVRQRRDWEQQRGTHYSTLLILSCNDLCVLFFLAVFLLCQVSNLRVGATAASFFLLVIGLLVFPSGPFIRPHPLVWRLAFGVGVVYQIFLIVILFQTKTQARESMKFFDHSLGVPVTERSYAADCALTWKNVYGNVDRFVLSHFIGWVVKALIVRDAVMSVELSAETYPATLSVRAHLAAIDVLLYCCIICLQLLGGVHPVGADRDFVHAHAAQLRRMLVGSMAAGRDAQQCTGHLRWVQIG
jgi:hypothetical protein